MKIDRNEKEVNKSGNKIIANIGIVFLVISIIGVTILSFGVLWKNRDSIPISLVSVNSKYINTWKDKFKYKNGDKNHSFNIKEKTSLNASWDVEDGYIEAKLYKDDKTIKEINSTDEPNYQELIDLSDYQGSKVILKLKFKKASGNIKFILE